MTRTGSNILILNTHLPVFPGGGGVEYLTTTRLAGLADHVGLVSMAHTRNDLDRTQGLADAGVDLYLWQSPNLDAAPSAPAPTVLRRVHAWFGDLVDGVKAWPSRPADTIILDGCFRNMAPGLRTALSKRPWDVLAVVESSAAAMLEYVPRPLVAILVMHDIRSVLYDRRAAASRSVWERWRLTRQARRYYKFERERSQQYDLITTVSEDDARWVRQHFRSSGVITVPLPVDAEYFSPQPSVAAIPGRIVFTGLMNHPPNADAAVYFAREVLPAVRKAIPGAEFHVVGRYPPPDVQMLERLPGVHVTGGVPDIRPHLAEATVVVVPLRYGSGARQKILEAWCMEKCVVSTTVGAEGLAYKDGANLVIADNGGSMAANVIRMLAESELRDAVRFAGREQAVRRHNPERIAADYYFEIKKVVAEKRSRPSPMRVAIDMRWMIPGLAGGLETVARSFLRQLIALDRHNVYRAILPARCRYDFELPDGGNFRIVTSDSWMDDLRRARQRVSRALHARLRLDYWLSQDVLDLRFARSLDAEIAYSFPGYIRPDLYPLRHVLLVPDIQHEYCPQFFTELALEERKRLYGDAVRRADHVCAISEFTRQTLIERLGVRPEKVTAIPLAADPMFSPNADHGLDASTLHKHGLTAGDYFYFPGHTWLHKNHRTAIEALRILRDAYKLTPLLVCSGGPREAQAAIEQQIAKCGLQDQVRFVGYCPQDEVPALYRGATGLVFPSLFEGFGIPVLEAMASGCPVICSNTTSLPEIAADAALLVEPLDAAAWADAMSRILANQDIRGDLRRRGLARAAGFSWERHTRDTVAVFHQVHQRLREA